MPTSNTAVGNWVAANLDTLERMIYAIDQLRFAARRSADELSSTGGWGGIDRAVDAARQTVATQAEEVGELPRPPDDELLNHLGAFVTEVRQFTNPDTIDEWIASWLRVVNHWDAFLTTLAEKTGQPTPKMRPGSG